MAETGYSSLFSDEVSMKIMDINDELEWASPKKKSFFILWLREKAHRAKIKGNASEKTLYLGAELAENIAKALKDDLFAEFDKQYMDYLYRCVSMSDFSDQSHRMIEEYMDEKRVLSELGKLSEHMMDNKMIYILTKVLREEPKEQWYKELIGVCEDSVIIRKYYAGLFGLPESEVYPVNGDISLNPKEIFYMVLSEGASPEAVMFIKKVKDSDKGRDFYVFCHENKADDGKLEYFTISDLEAPYVPIALRSENDSNMERFSLLAKETIDFSDSVYLEKPSISEIAERYALKNIADINSFEKQITDITKKEEDKKDWTFANGLKGEQIAAAPAYAKIKAFRFKMLQFESMGSYSIPLSKLIELMQDEERDQQDLTNSIFDAMCRFTEIAKAKSSDMQKERQDREESLLRGQQAQKPSPER